MGLNQLAWQWHQQTWAYKTNNMKFNRQCDVYWWNDWIFDDQQSHVSIYIHKYYVYIHTHTHIYIYIHTRRDTCLIMSDCQDRKPSQTWCISALFGLLYVHIMGSHEKRQLATWDFKNETWACWLAGYLIMEFIHIFSPNFDTKLKRSVKKFDFVTFVALVQSSAVRRIALRGMFVWK